MVCEPLIGQPMDVCINQNPYLTSLELADWADQGSRLEVDVLIGSDYYWDLVTGAVSKSTGGPTAIHTKLGWVLSGPIAVGDSNQCSTNLVTTHVLRVDAQPDPLNDQLRAFGSLNHWEYDQMRKTYMMTPAVTSSSEKADMRYHCIGNSFKTHYQITTT